MSMGSEEGDKHLQTEGVPSALGLIASHVVRIWDDDYDDVPKKNTQAKTAKKRKFSLQCLHGGGLHVCFPSSRSTAVF